MTTRLLLHKMVLFLPQITTTKEQSYSLVMTTKEQSLNLVLQTTLLYFSSMMEIQQQFHSSGVETLLPICNGVILTQPQLIKQEQIIFISEHKLGMEIRLQLHNLTNAFYILKRIIRS